MFYNLKLDQNHLDLLIFNQSKHGSSNWPISCFLDKGFYETLSQSWLRILLKPQRFCVQQSVPGWTCQIELQQNL